MTMRIWVVASAILGIGLVMGMYLLTRIAFAKIFKNVETTKRVVDVADEQNRTMPSPTYSLVVSPHTITAKQSSEIKTNNRVPQVEVTVQQTDQYLVKIANPTISVEPLIAVGTQPSASPTAKPTIFPIATLTLSPQPTTSNVESTPAPTIAPNQPPPFATSISGDVVKIADTYVFNQQGGSVVTDNRLEIKWPTNQNTYWLNFRLKLISAETTVGFDDPCVLVLLNGTPLFGIGSFAYQKITSSDGLSISLRLLPDLLFFQSNQATMSNTISILAGENGDLLGHTMVEIELEDFTNQPRHRSLESMLPNSYPLVEKNGYYETQFTHPTELPFLLTNWEKDFLLANQSLPVEHTYSYLRTQATLYWFSQNMLGYGYAIRSQNDLSSSLSIFPLDYSLPITVLPK